MQIGDCSSFAANEISALAPAQTARDALELRLGQVERICCRLRKLGAQSSFVRVLATLALEGFEGFEGLSCDADDCQLASRFRVLQPKASVKFAARLGSMYRWLQCNLCVCVLLLLQPPSTRLQPELYLYSQIGI